jgi:hypothetical protein
MMTHAARVMAPVFVVGGPRSGTAWLYHLLLSSGGFAVAMADRDAGEARPQGVSRWADCSPGDLLRVEQIKRAVPDALFLHIVRDGRDVACSLAQQATQQPPAATRLSGILRAGVYWEWMLRRGREQVRKCGSDAMEVRFEALVARPEETLASIGTFLAHDLDYERIRQWGIGTVCEPNTAFASDALGPLFRPVGRWQRRLSVRRLARLEAGVGGLLEELGYPLYTDQVARQRVQGNVRFRRSLARACFSSWHWLRTETPVGRVFTRRSRIDRLIADEARTSPAPRKHTV